jgi:hypothetical protein
MSVAASMGVLHDCGFNCTTDDAMIVAVTGPWPVAAQAIIDASGAQVY